MKLQKIFLCLCSLFILVSFSFSVRAIEIKIAPSLATNAYGSPSWPGYVTNALIGLSTGSTSVGGDPLTTDPTGYRVTHNVTPYDLVVSGFPSWHGIAEPSAPFNNELGTRLHMGLAIIGDGTKQFRLNDLNFTVSSTDPYNSSGFAGNFVGYNYTATRYGVDWGADRAPGGGDDTVYTSGNGLTFVDALYYVGVGNAFAVYDSDPGVTRQDKLNLAALGINGIAPFDININYTMMSPDGSVLASANDLIHVSSVPTPAALPFGLVMVASFAGFNVWRKNRLNKPV